MLKEQLSYYSFKKKQLYKQKALCKQITLNVFYCLIMINYIEKSYINEFTHRIFSVLLIEDTFISVIKFIPKRSFEFYDRLIYKKNFLNIKKTISCIKTLNPYIIHFKCPTSLFNLINSSFLTVLMIILVKYEQILKRNTRKTPSIYSIHIIFEFIEREWEYSTFFLMCNMLNFYHPEIIIRLLRLLVLDTTFLHIMKLYFYFVLNKRIQKKNILNIVHIQLNVIFYHIYKQEILKYLNILYYKQIFVNIYNINIDNVISAYFKYNNKRKSYSSNLYKEKRQKRSSFLYQQKTIKNIIVYKKYFLLGSNDNRDFLSCESILFFLQQRIASFTYLTLLNSIFYLKNNLFLGHLLNATDCQFLLSIYTGLNLKNIYMIRNIRYLFNPTDYIIHNLSQYNFCTYTGNPINKSNWSILQDNMIIERFEIIINNLLSYYSGCKNKKNLFFIVYILRYSCIKTLACKHKRTVNNLLKKNNSLLYQKITKDLFIKQISFKKRFWNFNIYKVYQLYI